nr:hypothetical protein [Bacillus thuringiensis]
MYPKQLPKLGKEFSRVLRPGGIFIAQHKRAIFLILSTFQEHPD